MHAGLEHGPCIMCNCTYLGSLPDRQTTSEENIVGETVDRGTVKNPKLEKIKNDVLSVCIVVLCVS